MRSILLQLMWPSREKSSKVRVDLSQERYFCVKFSTAKSVESFKQSISSFFYVGQQQRLAAVVASSRAGSTSRQREPLVSSAAAAD